NCLPTAQTSFDEIAVTAYRVEFRTPGPIIVQLLPSQCSINAVPEVPTAHTSLLATAATPRSVLLVPSKGVGTTCQLLPSKCSASDCGPRTVFTPPTAQMSLAAIAAVLHRSPRSTVGLGTPTRLFVNT